MSLYEHEYRTGGVCYTLSVESSIALEIISYSNVIYRLLEEQRKNRLSEITDTHIYITLTCIDIKKH